VPPVTTFSTASRARLRHAKQQAKPAQRLKQKTRSAAGRVRETRRVRDHQGQKLSDEWARPVPGQLAPLPQAGGHSPLRSLWHRAMPSRREWPVAAARCGSADESRVCGFSPQTGARLSGGRPEPVKGAPSARPCFARQTLDRTRPRVPRPPIAPVGLRGGVGEADPHPVWIGSSTTGPSAYQEDGWEESERKSLVVSTKSSSSFLHPRGV
jgi:hypothetical protein